MTSRTTERFPLTEPTDRIHAQGVFGSPIPVIIVALAIILAAIIAIRPLAVPPALSGDATGGFDITRALHDLEIITAARGCRDPLATTRPNAILSPSWKRSVSRRK